jgi:co-chaperonin GroES (HSP10)
MSAVDETVGWEYLSELDYEVLGDRVVVRPDEEQGVLAREADGMVRRQAGDKELFTVHEPGNDRIEEAITGVVVGVGKGVDVATVGGPVSMPMHVKEGDRVYHSKYGYTTLKIGDEELFSMPQERIVMVHRPKGE